MTSEGPRVAILRLTNGGDVLVKLSVPDAISAIHVGSGATDFVEMPTEDGPIHVRPGSVIAVLESFENKRSGFRVVPGS